MSLPRQTPTRRNFYDSSQLYLKAPSVQLVVAAATRLRHALTLLLSLQFATEMLRSSLQTDALRTWKPLGKTRGHVRVVMHIS